MSHAQELINAVQSCQVDRLRAVIDQLNRLSDAEVAHLDGNDRLWARKSYLNDQLEGPLDLTALHVAAKGYAAYKHDSRLASIFNEMVAVLLEAGASPWVEVGATVVARPHGNQRNPGKTVPEVCEGKMPPALSEWIAKECNDLLSDRSTARHAVTKVAEVTRMDKWKERKQAKASGKATIDGLAAQRIAERLYVGQWPCR